MTVDSTNFTKVRATFGSEELLPEDVKVVSAALFFKATSKLSTVLRLLSAQTNRTEERLLSVWRKDAAALSLLTPQSTTGDQEGNADVDSDVDSVNLEEGSCCSGSMRWDDLDEGINRIRQIRQVQRTYARSAKLVRNMSEQFSRIIGALLPG